ncbi:CD160 antigen [Erinaceus europaeus]|uniref:CD160 antigen n=1 Tax=Erinaceus europaeus TaxID=9365 RepID=A0A1S3WIK7_ERIEU|nr:CD160 antigen [Erinaceus europaeus]
MQMAHGRGYLALVILLATVNIRFGACMQIFNSVSKEGNHLRLICTVKHKIEEAEGLVVFLCKNRSLDCSPETSLQQMRPKRKPRADGDGEVSSQLVFTINQVMPTDSGTYQCAARSKEPDIHLQGWMFSISVTETGNYTLTGLQETGHPTFSHTKSASGFLRDTVWVVLTTCLLALQAL